MLVYSPESHAEIVKKIASHPGLCCLYIPGWALDYKVFAYMGLEGGELEFGSPRASCFVSQPTTPPVGHPSTEGNGSLRASEPQVSAALKKKKPPFRGVGGCLDIYVGIADPAYLPQLKKLIDTHAHWQLIGLSLGAAMAIELATHCPHIESVIGIGMRDRYGAGECRLLRRQMEKDKTEALQRFWMVAYGWAATSEAGAVFLAEDILYRGLAYLVKTDLMRMNPPCFVACWHGENDLISPSNAAYLCANHKQWEWQELKDQPHIPIWRDIQQKYDDSPDT